MYRFVILALALVACARGASIGDRIIGGANAVDRSYPWQVSLQRDLDHFCGGAIIARKWILTAAHCVDSLIYQLRPSLIRVLAGTKKLNEGGLFFQGSKVIVHPEWNRLRIRNDLALIKLTRSLPFTTRIQPIPLPSADFTKSDYPASLSGWGAVSFPDGAISNDLQQVSLRIIDQRWCSARYIRVTDSNICTSTEPGKGACQGDSGSPLIADGVLVGIASWGTLCAHGDPDVFTRVWSFVDWINENIVEE